MTEIRQHLSRRAAIYCWPAVRAADKVVHLPVNVPLTGEEAEGATEGLTPDPVFLM